MTEHATHTNKSIVTVGVQAGEVLHLSGNDNNNIWLLILYIINYIHIRAT